MNDYFSGAIAQLLERGEVLVGKIPVDLPLEFHALSTACQTQLGVILADLRALLKDPKMAQPALQPERLRRFRRAVDQLNRLESTALNALTRADEHDLRLNRLIDRIRTEIRFPLLPPTVSALSPEYFCIVTDFNLLLAPPNEGDFLLHLPDLYHELGHPLLITKSNPRVRPFQAAFSEATNAILDALERERIKEERRSTKASQRLADSLSVWQSSWAPWWMTEFFCDLFALYTLGPAYAWSHFHLSVKRGGNPFELPIFRPTTHPADDARMTTLLCGLNQLGYNAEAGEIEARWQELIALTGAKPDPDYVRCFPKALLLKISILALEGVRGMNCRLATPGADDEVHSLLNQAWQTFWSDPHHFAAWEKQAVQRLGQI